MKSINLLLGLLSPILLGQFLSCSSLKKAKLAEYPEFEKNAQKFVITSPLSHFPSGSNQFTIEDISADTVFELKTRAEDPEFDRKTIEKRKTDEGFKAKNRESVSYKFYLAKPFYEGEYEVIGNTTILRTEEDDGDRGSESSRLVYPLEFWIFDEGRDVGKITVSGPGLDLTLNIDALIHDKQLQLEYQPGMTNKRNIAIENEQGLLALMHSKPAGFITTKQKGDFLIKAGLEKELKSDILATYMIVETVMGIISEGNK